VRVDEASHRSAHERGAQPLAPAGTFLTLLCRAARHWITTMSRQSWHLCGLPRRHSRRCVVHLLPRRQDGAPQAPPRSFRAFEGLYTRPAGLPEETKAIGVFLQKKQEHEEAGTAKQGTEWNL
jgi:hypothetical protein